MNTIKLLEKKDREIERLFSQYRNLSEVRTRRKISKQIADIMAESIKIEQVILSPAAHRTGLEPLLRNIVGEHLSVKRVIADLLDMIHDKAGYAPKPDALSPDEHAVIGENIEKLFARLRLQGLGRAAPAGTYQPGPVLH